MRIRPFLTLCLLLLCGFPPRLTAQGNLCLDSCLQWAVDNYPLVEQ